MSHYHCTVEYRDQSGRIRHHVLDLDAATGDEAAIRAEKDLMESEHARDAVRVEEVVCWIDETH